MKILRVNRESLFRVAALIQFVISVSCGCVASSFIFLHICNSECAYYVEYSVKP